MFNYVNIIICKGDRNLVKKKKKSNVILVLELEEERISRFGFGYLDFRLGKCIVKIILVKDCYDFKR